MVSEDGVTCGRACFLLRALAIFCPRFLPTVAPATEVDAFEFVVCLHALTGDLLTGTWVLFLVVRLIISLASCFLVTSVAFEGLLCDFGRPLDCVLTSVDGLLTEFAYFNVLWRFERTSPSFFDCLGCSDV